MAGILVLKHFVQDTEASRRGPLLFRHLYDRTPEDLKARNVPELRIPVTLLGDASHLIALPPMPWWVAEAMRWRMKLPWPNHYGTTILLQLGRRF
jgi:hypothetical protein